MIASGEGRTGLRLLAGVSRWLLAALLAGALAPGCDHPFEPFEQSEEAVFSIFGYLDLRADTQWVRVMPVRQSLFLTPEPIDAVVTLEHLGTGRTVALRDSLFRFVDRQLGGDAYAYNFWTTEPLEPQASYRLRAVRSDGAATTAIVVMPPPMEFSLLNDIRSEPDTARLQVRSERLLLVDVYFAVETIAGDPAGSIPVRQRSRSPGSEPGTVRVTVDGAPLEREGYNDVRRQEIRIAVAPADWPYHAALSDVEIGVPGLMPTNVENGVGFVGGVETWTIPFHRCAVLVPRPGQWESCEIRYSTQTASIAGRVLRTCGDPYVLENIRLTERFAGGGAIVRTWKTGWDGRYWFEGIEPGAELVLQVAPGVPPVHVPPLAPGQRFLLEEVRLPLSC